MNIWQLKEYIKDLPDDMEVKLEIDDYDYVADCKVQKNQLIVY